MISRENEHNYSFMDMDIQQNMQSIHQIYSK